MPCLMAPDCSIPVFPFLPPAVPESTQVVLQSVQSPVVISSLHTARRAAPPYPAQHPPDGSPRIPYPVVNQERSEPTCPKTPVPEVQLCQNPEV